MGQKWSIGQTLETIHIRSCRGCKRVAILACEFIGVRELQAGPFTMNGGGHLSAVANPLLPNPAGTARAWAPNMLMRNAGFIRFMVGRAE